MAVNIFNIPVKDKINASLQAKSIMICGKSKTGKSTICAQAPKPIFLMTENGGEALTGFTPVPIASWSDFKSAVSQLCTAQGRQSFDTVVIDTYTNLILLLEKYIGAKMSTEKNQIDFASDADYGRGARGMRMELGFQLQKLANQGYLLLNIVHAEDKTDFATGRSYIGTSLSNSLFGVAEKFVDQIVYLKREVKNQQVVHSICYNEKGGFQSAGGRFSPDVDSSPCSFADLEKVMLRAIAAKAAEQDAETVMETKPSVEIKVEQLSFSDLMAEFTQISSELSKDNPEMVTKIREIIEKELGAGRRVSTLVPTQVELLNNIVIEVKGLKG